MLALGHDTNIKSGGTALPSNYVTFQNCGINSDIMNPVGDSLTLSEFNNPAQYRYGMPLGWISINFTSEPGGHALALNGVEGNYFKIYDPWGTVFNAAITNTGDGSVGKIQWISSTSLHDAVYGSGPSHAANIFSILWIWRYISIAGGPPPIASCQPCYSGTFSAQGACQ
jgi:hypothetical protein